MPTPKSSTRLPSIPDKRYFNIGEVAKLCLVKPSVLRFWENQFPVLKASKRVANRRYYQIEDIHVAREIRRLLYDEGFTIAGARQQLTQAHVRQELKTVLPQASVVKALKKAITSIDALLLKIKVK